MFTILTRVIVNVMMLSPVSSGNSSATTSVPPPAAAIASSSTPTADPALLVNVLDDLNLPSSSLQQQESSGSLTPGAEEGFMKFLFKNNGVLFENDILQIGIKSEYKKNLGMAHVLPVTSYSMQCDH